MPRNILPDATPTGYGVNTGRYTGGPGMPYAFSYAVNDAASNNYQARTEESDGLLTEGEYRSLMPDGRVQIVK